MPGRSPDVSLPSSVTFRARSFLEDEIQALSFFLNLLKS